MEKSLNGLPPMGCGSEQEREPSEYVRQKQKTSSRGLPPLGMENCRNIEDGDKDDASGLPRKLWTLSDACCPCAWLDGVLIFERIWCREMAPRRTRMHVWSAISGKAEVHSKRSNSMRMQRCTTKKWDAALTASHRPYWRAQHDSNVRPTDS